MADLAGGKLLAVKLGITSDTRLLLIREPDGLPSFADAPPPKANAKPGTAPYDLALAFCLTLAELHQTVERWPPADAVWPAGPRRRAVW